MKSNLCIFFLAGHDTTANTLGFVLYELAINPVSSHLQLHIDINSSI